LSSYDLPNLPYIIEDIKKEGNIEYKGAKSFTIAKNNSIKQEAFWEIVLKEKYGENISTQYKYQQCIFDFLNISTNTIYECKLNLKDFNEEQYKKYLIALKEYKIYYIIGYDCVINIDESKIYTTDKIKYKAHQIFIESNSKKSKLDEIIKDFEIVEVDNESLRTNSV
jgi:hypothetical protein